MRKILIPTDFSENASNAVRYAFDMFHGIEDVEYVLLNAYDVPHGGSNTMLVSITDILKKDSEAGLKKCLKKMEMDTEKHNIRTISMHGTLSAVIEEILKKEDFNLIVMGTLGAGGLKKVLLGSNTSDVVKKIKRPVLIVPHAARYELPDKILLTTDFKPIRRDLQIERLRDFANRLGSEILVLNVHEERQKNRPGKGQGFIRA
jgi:nucleotide-binding universal stress UspA family protein